MRFVEVEEMKKKQKNGQSRERAKVNDGISI